VVGIVPYGASKGALDRITLAAAQEFAHLGICACAVNPGPIDTGWMRTRCALCACARRRWVGSARRRTPRIWWNSSARREVAGINGQLIYSNGGFS
jgi:3-oxoacyl-[acyl-carrier protein] reductase